MTSTQQKLFMAIKKIWRAVPTSIDDISTAVGRIFGPDDDDYPKTGVQPFSGDADDDRHRRHRHDS